MAEIGIGIVGGGYMGKAHAAAMLAVGALFATKLRPRLEMVCASTSENAARYARDYGFSRFTDDWRELVSAPEVEAVVVASPQSTHREIVLGACARGLPVFCEKPLGASLAESEAMVAAAEDAGVPNMIGFNYVRTPATQYARKLIAEGALGRIVWFRGEHAEDFLHDPRQPATWRCQGRANGVMGDLAPHMINCARALMGSIFEVSAAIETTQTERLGPDGPVAVTNDDQAQIMCRFDNGAMGHLCFSRVATGRKMGYAYEVVGDEGSIRFDQEDQNALWLYRAEGPESQRGFRKILTGPSHPDYLPFCQGPGHGTGYQDQIIIEAKDFLTAIETGEEVWPAFREGLEVSRVVEAAFASSENGTWQRVQDFGV